jgi:3-deoxy-D-manno-octulosonic-acid transferase
MIFLYDLILRLADFFLRNFLFLFPSKIQKQWKELQKPWPKLQGDVVLIHAASGEIEYAKPLLRWIRQLAPDKQILLTYTSPSILKLLPSAEFYDACVPLPLDEPGRMNEFLQHFQPQQILIARTDLWYHFLATAKKLQIPTFLFSYTQKKNLSFWSRQWRKKLLNLITEIHCVHSTDKDELQSWGLSTSIEVTGDTRIDQVIYRLENPRAVPLKVQHQDPVFIFGSTWPEDEEQIFVWIPFLLKKGFRILLAPHEVHAEHLQRVMERAQRLEKVALFSSGKWTTEKILIVDQVGYLAELYRLGQYAFIGGSFRRKVHSVMEAFAAGLLVVTGPYIQNNREAVLGLQKSWMWKSGQYFHLVNILSTPSKALQFFNELPLINPWKKEIEMDLLDQYGASQRLVRRILD